MVPKTLNLVTGNKNKLLEIQAILKGIINVHSTPLDLPEVQGTLEEVSVDKCRRAAEAVNGPVLVEDTALCFKALNDLPGPYIKWFLNAIGHDGLNKMLDGFDDRSAEAVTTLAYCEGPGNDPILFQGRTNGKIVPPRGSLDFGWDPIFEVDGEGKTYGEMEKSFKNTLSHRQKALAKLQEWLASQS